MDIIEPLPFIVTPFYLHNVYSIVCWRIVQLLQIRSQITVLLEPRFFPFSICSASCSLVCLALHSNTACHYFTTRHVTVG